MESKNLKNNKLKRVNISGKITYLHWDSINEVITIKYTETSRSVSNIKPKEEEKK